MVIPVYNTEKYINKCLANVLSQTLKDIEVICIDDGSTDGSYKVLEEYAKEDSRMMLIHQENQGQAAARNTGTQMAQGEYLCFVDSDDWIDETALELLYNKAIEENLDVLYFGGCTDYETLELKERFGKYYDPAYKRTDNGGIILHGIEMLRCQREKGQFWKSACMSLIRREYIKSNHISFRDGIVHEDNIYSFLLCVQAERTAIITDELYHRLIRDDSTMTSKTSSKHLYGYIVSMMGVLDYWNSHKFADEDVVRPIIDDYLKDIKLVWRKLDEDEKDKVRRMMTDEKFIASEGMIYNGFLLPYLQHMDFIENEKQKKEKTIVQLMNSAEGMKKEIQTLNESIKSIYNSHRYKIGNMILAPISFLGKLYSRTRS